MLNFLEKKITQLSASHEPVRPLSFHHFLVGLSKGYALAVNIRGHLFTAGLLKSKTLPCRIVSVGNMVAGGAGKTPVTLYLAHLFKRLGKKVVVVSRGYRGTYAGDARIVGDGIEIFLDAEQAGDEPYMMANLKLCPVVVGKDRYKAGLKAVDAFDADIIILDDAFQHQRLKRDLDLVLLDYENPFGNGKLLPAGRLRESVKAGLTRADGLIFTRTPGKMKSTVPPPSHQTILAYKKNAVFRSFHKPCLACLIFGKGRDRTSNTGIHDLKGRTAVLLSGIANNRSFYSGIKECGIKIVEHLEFKDHYGYKKSDVDFILKKAKDKGADILLTTSKDWVKLSRFQEWNIDIGVVDVSIEFENPEKFESFICTKLHLS